MSNGWISLNREISNHWVWDCEFSTGQAWVDLLLHACHSKGKLVLKGQLIELSRGQQARSELTLSKKWKWSRNKVRRFLKNLENDGMIEQKTGHLTSIITICKYDIFQTNVSTDETTKGHLTKQQQDIMRYTNNNDNNVNNKEPGNKLPDDAPKKSPSKAKGLTEFPDGFEITESMVLWFTEQDFKYIDLGRATDKWVDAMKAKGSRYKDWTAAWRNGMNNAEKWSVPK